jgi:hypothetical protein
MRAIATRALPRGASSQPSVGNDGIAFGRIDERARDDVHDTNRSGLDRERLRRIEQTPGATSISVVVPPPLRQGIRR